MSDPQAAVCRQVYARFGALKGVRPDVRDKVTANLSTRAAENLAEEVELLGQVRMSMVEEEQAKIVRVIRSLEDSGQIVI
jgi:flagellar motor switch protein FliG